MMRKIFVVGLLLCSFLVVSISPSVIAEGPYTITDTTGDVINYDTGEIATSSPNIDIDNIDIVEMTYSRQDTSVTLTLEVNGSIENRGSISDLESDVADVAIYSLMIYNSNSNESYAVYYINNECQITYQSTEETKNITASDFLVSDSTITVSFDLLSNDETYDNIYAETSYYKMSDAENEYLYDAAPDLTTLDVIIDAPSDGRTGESIVFSGGVSGGTPPYSGLWDFADGATSTDQNPIHSYAEAGTYEVTLSVIDAGGNEGSDYFTITISDGEPSNDGDIDGKQDGESSNSGLIAFVAIIAVIVIGIAIIVYILRR
jgi:hypothetical protein